LNFVAAMACGANFAATSADSWIGATVLFCTSSPSQSWAPTMTSGPLPTLVASLKFARTSVATWTATLMPFSAPNSSAYFFRIGARSLSAQITRSAAASRDGAPVVVGEGAAVVVVVVPEGVAEAEAVAVESPPPHALTSRAATPVTAAAPKARLCMKSPCCAQGASLRP
jgi:hypothetical protein